MLPRVPNCTTRRAGPGRPRAASISHAFFTRRRCYKTAWSLLQGDRTAMAIIPRARNCTTRRAGPGLSQTASTPHSVVTRRRCYKTAWSLSQGDLTADPGLTSTLNWDTATAKIHWDGSERETISQLTERLDEQGSQIKKVNSQLEASRPAPQTVVSDQ